MIAGPENNDAAMQEVLQLLCSMLENPATRQQAIEFIQQICDNGDEQASFLSQQAPLNYDLPSYGGGYSVLNSPAGNLPPSVAYQPLS